MPFSNKKRTSIYQPYSICIREVLPGFSLLQILKILKEVIARKIDSALLMVSKAQTDLYQEKKI